MNIPIPSSEVLNAIRPRIQHMIHRTPVMTSRLLDQLTGGQLFLKCENFQRMGAFKMRGASYAISQLSDQEKSRGVVTHSSGNFAQALALAAQGVSILAYVAMPENAPPAKKAAVRDYGGVIIESGNSPAERESRAREVMEETGATFIHPSNDINVILGNATAAQELIETISDLDMIVVPVGGGGLIAGTALAAHHLNNQISIIGAEPAGADDAHRSLRDGEIYTSDNPRTICDGLRTNLGDVNFPIIRSLVKEIILVDDADTITAMKYIFERVKIVVEPSAAITLGAVLTNPEMFRGRRTGLILSGGNIDLSWWDHVWRPVQSP